MILTDAQRREIIQIRLENAEEALRDAERLLGDGSLRGAANRTYYAVFHAVSALALSRGVSFKKHGSLLAYFHKEFVKTGILERAHGRTVQKAADDRTDADYSDIVTFTAEQIDTRTKECRSLLKAVEPLIQDFCG